MDLGLKGQRVLVTGGSLGIGFACAAGFLAEGARVAIASRSEAHVSDALARLPGAQGFPADCRDPQAAAGLVAAVEEAIGPLDILVNSAGAARRTPAPSLNPAAWRDAMEAKYFTAINVIDPTIKRMAARGRGVIVTIIGTGGKFASPIHIAGGAANAALMLATAGLGHAYAERGVRVLGVSPGLTETGRVAEGFAADAAAQGIAPEESRRRAVARLPLGRMTTPEEVAATVLFLSSAQAAAVTGATLSVDGGACPTVL